MIKESSSGIIPISVIDGNLEVFVVQHKNGEHWGFPKGHIECDESPKETAERELFEETGLKVLRFFHFSPLNESYLFQRGEQTVDKNVGYYLAEVTRKYSLQVTEIKDGKWLKLDELNDYITFDEGRKVCNELKQILQ